MKALKYIAAFTLGAAFMAATDVALENTEAVDFVTHEYRLHTVTEDMVYGEAIDGYQPGGIVYERDVIEDRIGVDLEEEDVIEFMYTYEDATNEDWDEPLYIKLRGYDAQIKPMEGQ